MKSYRQVLIDRVPAGQRRSARALVQAHGLPSPGSLRALIRVLERISPSPPVPIPPAPPTINATTQGSGVGTILIVTGSGFLPNKIVTVRITDDALSPERTFQQSSTPDGKLLDMRMPLPCNSGFSFHVSATDSRPGPGILGVVFSNVVTLRCP